jgi:iron complex transport system substrate-binding protein
VVRAAPLASLVLALVALAVGCQDRAASPVPKRVVSLSPNTTEAMFAIGAGHALVGRSAHCDYPADAQKLPSVGGYADPNIEMVLSLEPDLVISERGPAGPALEERLRGHGIATFFPATDSIADVQKMLLDLGARFGAEARARELTEAMQARIDRIEAWAKKKKSPTIVMVFDTSPLFVAGPGSYPDELLRIAGGKNLIDRGGKWPTIDVERLLALDPDVIVDAVVMEGESGKSSRLVKAPGFSELRAVKERRVRRLRNDAPLRPGPRLADGLWELAHAVHGEEPPK